MDESLTHHSNTRCFRIPSSQILGTNCAEDTCTVSLELKHMGVWRWTGGFPQGSGRQLGGSGHVYFGVAL